jgi:hypothetical protein
MERLFSALKLLKTGQRNRGGEMLNAMLFLRANMS